MDLRSLVKRGKQEAGVLSGLIKGLTVDIGGISVKLRAEDAARAEALSFVEQLPARPGPAQISLSFGGSPVPLPAEPSTEVYDGTRFWRIGDEVHLDWEGRVTAGATDRSIDLGVTEIGLLPIVNYLLPFTLAHSLAYWDRLLVRGGAICRGERAILVLGGLGAGKSTAVLAAMGCGWDALSDDSSVLSEAGGRLQATGLQKQFYVPEEALDGSEEAAPAEGDARGRWMVERPDFRHRICEVAGVVVVRHGSSGDSGAGRMPREALSPMLVESFPAGLPTSREPVSLQRVARLLDLASSLPAWDLPLSQDPAARTTRLRQDLESIAGALDLPGASQ